MRKSISIFLYPLTHNLARIKYTQALEEKWQIFRPQWDVTAYLHILLKVMKNESDQGFYWDFLSH